MSTNLAVAQDPSFNLPVLSDPERVTEIMQMNLEGTAPTFSKVKIPSGGGIAFELPGEDEVEISLELVGVILDHYSVNAFWSEEYSGQNNPPDCSALDGKTGEVRTTGERIPCISCRMNQWGSDPESGRGKACKNLHRLYILREGEIFPLLLTLPPTSLRNFTEYMKRLTNKMHPHFGVITKAKLQKAQNKDGVLYSQAVFSRMGDLSREETMAIKKYADTIKGSMRTLAVESAEYETPEEGSSNNANPVDSSEPF